MKLQLLTALAISINAVSIWGLTKRIKPLEDFREMMLEDFYALDCEVSELQSADVGNALVLARLVQNVEHIRERFGLEDQKLKAEFISDKWQGKWQ